MGEKRAAYLRVVQECPQQKLLYESTFLIVWKPWEYHIYGLDWFRIVVIIIRRDIIGAFQNFRIFKLLMITFLCRPIHQNLSTCTRGWKERPKVHFIPSRPPSRVPSRNFIFDEGWHISFENDRWNCCF